MTRPGITATFTLLLICAQFGAIIWLMRAADIQRERLAVMREELVDWEQIAATYRSSAARYAITSEKCQQTMRIYQSSIFQPAEMRK